MQGLTCHPFTHNIAYTVCARVTDCVRMCFIQAHLHAASVVCCLSRPVAWSTRTGGRKWVLLHKCEKLDCKRNKKDSLISSQL